MLILIDYLLFHTLFSTSIFSVTRSTIDSLPSPANRTRVATSTYKKLMFHLCVGRVYLARGIFRNISHKSRVVSKRESRKFHVRGGRLFEVTMWIAFRILVSVSKLEESVNLASHTRKLSLSPLLSLSLSFSLSLSCYINAKRHLAREWDHIRRQRRRRC